jgi:hypothetical protein
MWSEPPSSTNLSPVSAAACAYSCTGPLANMCTPEHNYGGCWRNTIGGKFYHSCFDDIRTFRWMGQYGITNDSTPTYRCECPPCFRETPSGGCEPACDLSYCLGAEGCGPSPAGGGRGEPAAGPGLVPVELGVLPCWLCERSVHGSCHTGTLLCEPGHPSAPR